MPKFKHALIAAVAIPALMLGAVACNDDADSESSASQESIDETNARVQRNEMLWANLALQQQPLHDFDELGYAAGQTFEHRRSTAGVRHRAGACKE